MNSPDNMLLKNPMFNSEIKNKGFVIIDEMFKEHGWHTAKNESNWIHYTKLGDETTYFDIKIAADRIMVSVPIKNSVYQFVSTFKSYYEASEYIEQKFFDYIR